MIDSYENRILAGIFMSRILTGLAIFFAATLAAHADMELSPLRQVISADHPEVFFEVSNPSGRMLEGRVTWIDLAATETGYEEASPTARQTTSAAPYLLVSPANFRLEPGARVKVSVKLRKGMRIPRGERRSHLLIETAASRTPLRRASNGLQVDIGLGMSAPVLLRNGGNAAPIIGETRLLRDKNGALLLETMIVPGGDNSAYGRIVVDFRPEGDSSAPQTLSSRSNVAAYLDAQSRKIEAPLGLTSLGAGELTIRYEGMSEYEGRVFDTRTFAIAPPK